MTKIIDYFIDGKLVTPNGGAQCDSRNPATGDVIASVALDDISAADAAIIAAKDAFPSWSETPVGE